MRYSFCRLLHKTI